MQALCWLLLACPHLLIASSGAQASAIEANAFADMPEGEQIRTLIRLARDGRHDQATALLAAYPLTGTFASNRTLFIEGLILKAQGHLPTATMKYRAILTGDPTLAMVRAELAHTLYLLGDNDGASHELELLRAGAPEDEEARDIAAVIEAISSGSTVAINLEMNESANTRIVVVSGVPFEIGESTESGGSFAAGIDAAYSEALEDRLAAIVGRGTRALQYQGLSEPGCISAKQESRSCEQYPVSEIAEMRYKTQAGYLGFGSLSLRSLEDQSDEESDWLHLDDENSSWALGPRFTLFHAMAPDLALTSEVTLLHQDGWRTTAEGKIAKVFSDDLAGYASGGVERFDADQQPGLDYWSFFGSVGVVNELPWNISARSEIAARRRVYDGPSFSEPAFPRHDLEVGTSLSLWKRDLNLWGYSPVIEYSFNWNGSNVGFFDYASHTVDFRLTKEF